MLLTLFTTFWLGILTSISPCPLATNIAAISFVSYRISNRWVVFFSGILYMLGRTLTYTIIGFFVVKALINVPIFSNLLQHYMGKILGLLLIVVGMFLLDMFKFKLSGLTVSEKIQKKLDEFELIGAFIMGFLFALAFCPISAALFFGSAIPLAIKIDSPLLVPLVFGIGTAVPVLAFAILVSISAAFIDKIFHKIAVVELYTRKATGIILILAGIYMTLKYIYGISLI